LNEASAELSALAALFDRVVPAGMVILDDYEWAMSYRAQKLAEDPWFEARTTGSCRCRPGKGWSSSAEAGAKPNYDQMFSMVRSSYFMPARRTPRGHMRKDTQRRRQLGQCSNRVRHHRRDGGARL
jgi:hypothetical protein